MAAKERIFLAHASEDKPEVRKLYHRLKERGFSPWLDAIDLMPGQNWREEIPKAIEDAAVCLACLSHRSVAKESYVRREFRYALSAYAERSAGSIYLIPVRLDDCEMPDVRIPKLDLDLRDLQWVDLFEDDGFEKLVGAIGTTLRPLTWSRHMARSQPKEYFKVSRDVDASWCPEMLLLPAGKFQMGSPKDESDRSGDEVQHKVRFTKPFLLGCYAVTFDEYDHFCGVTGRIKPEDEGWGRGRLPVINVSHNDAVAYCTWLSEATGRCYHLPSEAQWEYACRAGTETPFSFGANITTDQVNYNGDHPYDGAAKGEHRKKTVPVGSLDPNPWGLHEMHGNVWEWCADWYGRYPSKAATDPRGATGGSKCVVRGGSWDYGARGARCADRAKEVPINHHDDLGFRCARVHEES